MTIDRIFFAYIALVGAAVGVTLVVAPHVQSFAIKPYFWVLIAVGLFDGGIYLLGRTSPGALLTMNARLAGFVIGIVLMVMIPTFGWCAGSIFLTPLSISQFEYPVAAAVTSFGRGDAIARHIPPQHIGAMPA